VELRFNTNLPFFASKVALYYFITDTFEWWHAMEWSEILQIKNYVVQMYIFIKI
jgi:hypothetical protein